MKLPKDLLRRINHSAQKVQFPSIFPYFTLLHGSILVKII